MVRDRRLLLALKLGLSLFSCEVPPIVAKEAKDILAVYLPMWRTRRKNLCCWATRTSRYGWAQPGFGHREPGRCHRVGQHRSPSHRPGHAAGLSLQLAWHSSATVRNHTQLRPSSYAGTTMASGSSWAHGSSRPAVRGTGGDGSQPGAWTAVWRNACLGTRKRLRLTHHAAAQTRTVLPASQEHPVTSAAAPVPMYQSMKGWHVLWKRLPVPVPSPPSRRDAKHTLWQADDSMTQTYIQRGLRHVGCSLSTSLTL